ncbi:MAG: hypothetical protein AAFU73_05260 [Planctomycetota bacterium]
MHVRSRSGLFRMIQRGDCPQPDFRIGNKPRWVRSRFERWLEQRADAAAAACEERVQAGDTKGARKELKKLEDAAEALDRDAS